MALLALTCACLAACGDSAPPASPERPAGQAATEERPVVPGGFERGSTVRLSSATLGDGRRIVLGSQGGGSEVGACLRIAGLDDRLRMCGRAPSEVEPSKVGRAIVAGPIAQASEEAALEVFGTTSPAVERVVLRYADDGGPRSVEATLLRVNDRDGLRRASIDRPFGYFIAELPADTEPDEVRAVAFDSGGAVMGAQGYGNYEDLPRRSFISGG